MSRPFITEKYTFGLATADPCATLCAPSDVARWLLYVALFFSPSSFFVTRPVEAG